MPEVTPTQTSSEDTDTAETNAQHVDAQDTVEDTELSSDGDSSGASHAMPDPVALLSYVTMQMDAKSLAGALLGIFAGQAWRAMGLVADPMTGQTEKNLPEAQLAIDCVQFLLGKVENDLPEPERREIQRRLNDLRMNYVMKLREG